MKIKIFILHDTEIFVIGPIIPIPNLFYLGKETIFSQQRSQCFVLISLQAAALPSHPQDSKLELSTQILCTLINLCKVGAWMTPSYKAEPLLCEGKHLIWHEESNPSIKGDIFHPGTRNENSLHVCGAIWHQSSSWNRQREPIVITWAANLQQKKNPVRLFAASRNICVLWGRENRARNLQGKPKTGN